METDALQYLCKQVQDLFEASETVTVTIYNIRRSGNCSANLKTGPE